MNEHITPTDASHLVNAVLKAEKVFDLKKNDGSIKQVRPQQMYNYTLGRIRSGERPTIACSEENGIDRNDLVRWLKQYIAKQRKQTVTLAPLVLHEEFAEESTLEAIAQLDES